MERFARQPVDLPLLHRDGAEPLVEADGRRVPLQDAPLEPAAAPLDGERGERGEQPSAESQAAPLGDDEEVFEIDAGLRQERRVVVEEEGEAGRLSVDFRDQDLRVGARPEEVRSRGRPRRRSTPGRGVRTRRARG